MIDCDSESSNRPKDISEWFYFVHKTLVKFAEYLGKEVKELSIDELILFFDTRDVMTLTSYISNIFPPTIPIQDEFYKNIQIFRSYKIDSSWVTGSNLTLTIQDAAAVYEYLKGKNPLFVYADPETEKEYKGVDNIVSDSSNEIHPYKKSLSYFRWKRIYLILQKGNYVPTDTYSYSNWRANWGRAGDK